VGTITNTEEVLIVGLTDSFLEVGLCPKAAWAASIKAIYAVMFKIKPRYTRDNRFRYLKGKLAGWRL